MSGRSTNDPCPICGEVGCRKKVYPRMLSEHAAGRNVAHWERIHGGGPGASEASYPPVMEQVGNAIGAAAAFVASGGVMVDDAERSRRLLICAECTHYDASQRRCRLCGCRLNLKARIASQHCPDKPSRW